MHFIDIYFKGCVNSYVLGSKYRVKSARNLSVKNTVGGSKIEHLYAFKMLRRSDNHEGKEGVGKQKLVEIGRAHV